MGEGDTKGKPIILHLGGPILYNRELHRKLQRDFTIIRPSVEERSRAHFLQALRDRRWGDFQAIMRPFWSSGGEMGRYDRELIPLLPSSLRVVASAGAGFDWADIDILGSYGIYYCNGGSAPAEAVADMALWMTISVFRNMTWTSQAAKSLSPEVFRDAHKHVSETAHNPRGHILGIIGLGKIGLLIAKKVNLALGMKVHYYDLHRKSLEEEKAVEAFFCESLEALVAVSDCVVLATPFGGERLITKDLLRKFKKGSRFVNIARGSLVDEDALVDALESGHLFAAGLDVHADEPNVNHKLGQMRNVTMTCHNGGGAIETRAEFERLALENVQSVLRGHGPLTPVNTQFMKSR